MSQDIHTRRKRASLEGHAGYGKLDRYQKYGWKFPFGANIESLQDAQKGSDLTHPTTARQDAPLHGQGRSMINVRPSGRNRSRYVKREEIRNAVMAIINR